MLPRLHQVEDTPLSSEQAGESCVVDHSCSHPDILLPALRQPRLPPVSHTSCHGQPNNGLCRLFRPNLQHEDHQMANAHWPFICGFHHCHSFSFTKHAVWAVFRWGPYGMFCIMLFLPTEHQIINGTKSICFYASQLSTCQLLLGAYRCNF